MSFGILFMFIFLQGIHWIVAVNMCRNESTISQDVSLNLIRGTGVNGCNCTVKLHRTDLLGSVQPQIVFKTVQFSGCGYQLVIPYEKTSPSLSCSNNSSIFHVINKTDEIKLYLESTSTQDDTEFEIKITTIVPGIISTLLELDCSASNVPRYPSVSTKAMISETTSSTGTHSTSTPSSSETPSHIVTNTDRSTPYTESTSDVSSPDMITSTQRTTEKSTPYAITSGKIISTTVPLPPTGSTTDLVNSMDSTTTQDGANGDDEDDDNGIATVGFIAGVVGGVISGVIVGVLILIMICIMKYKKKKAASKLYNSTLPQRQPEPENIYLEISPRPQQPENILDLSSQSHEPAESENIYLELSPQNLPQPDLSSRSHRPESEHIYLELI